MTEKSFLTRYRFALNEVLVIRGPSEKHACPKQVLRPPILACQH